MNIFKLFGEIALNNENANKGIDDTTNKAEKAGVSISSAFSKIGDVAVKAGKVVATGLAVGSAAVGALAKQSLDSYAEYEQLVGGIETLFGAGGKSIEEYANKVGKSTQEVRDEYDSLMYAQDLMMAQANSAYITAGMSANKYMETATSFAAALTSSCEDTIEAAEFADLAIGDMSDNANKMGTDISMIQNAYQGFAKQNYTMLDNLKLGYGGTATEMARLVNDSGVLGDAMIDLGDKQNVGAALAEVGFSNIVKAIHIVQNEMGIYGTTANEAATTIQGSIAMTKASWQNLLVGFADGSQDLTVLMGNLVTSATTAASNIVPRITQILSGISNALPMIMTTVATELPGMIEALLPGLVNGAVALVGGLTAMLPDFLKMLFKDLPQLFSKALMDSTNPTISALGTIFSKISSAVSSALQTIANNVKEVAAWISDHAEDIRTTVEELWEAAEDTWNSIGQPVFDLIMDCVGIVRDIFAEKFPEIKEFVGQCFTDIKNFWNNNLKPCFEAIGNFIEKVLAPVFELVFGAIIYGVVDTVFSDIKNLWNNVLKPVFTGITDFLTGVFTANWEQAFEGLVSIVDGIFNGFEDLVKRPLNKVISLVNGFIKGLNKITIPDWVPGIGGENLNIKLIPKLAKGGILDKGQVGLLEGSGAEAVVPLDQNRAWISAVAADMKAAGIGGGNSQEVKELKEAFQDFVQDLPAMMLDAFASMKFDVNNREFARMVKAVN